MSQMYEMFGSPPVMPTANPMQRMQNLMRAMQNPAAFVRQKFPDIPDQISQNPAQILQYLQRTRGISDQQISNQAAQARTYYGGSHV